MKRTLIIVLAVAAIGIPTALAQSPVGTPRQGDDPVAKILAQERGRRLDPRLFATPAPSIQIVESGGFHWGDAGIGAGTLAGLVLLGIGMTLVVRAGRVRSA